MKLIQNGGLPRDIKELRRMAKLNKRAIAKFTNHPYALKLNKEAQQ